MTTMTTVASQHVTGGRHAKADEFLPFAGALAVAASIRQVNRREREAWCAFHEARVLVESLQLSSTTSCRVHGVLNRASEAIQRYTEHCRQGRTSQPPPHLPRDPAANAPTFSNAFSCDVFQTSFFRLCRGPVNKGLWPSNVTTTNFTMPAAFLAAGGAPPSIEARNPNSCRCRTRTWAG